MEYIARPKKLYKEKIVPAMMEEFGYKSIMQVPKLEKIVVSQGLGAATADKNRRLRSRGAYSNYWSKSSRYFI
jgi:ribosomal protein L5